MIRFAAATAVLLATLGVVGLVGIAVGEFVPDGRVADALVEARRAGEIDDGAQEPTRLGNLEDRFTECIAISVGMGEAADAGFFETLAESPHLGPCPNLVDALDQYDAGGGLREGRPYLRYWHGTSPLFRTVIALFGLASLRMLLFLAMAAAVAALAWRVGRLVGWGAGIALVAPLVLTSDFLDLNDLAHHSASMTVAVGGAYTTFAIVERWPSRVRSWFVPVFAGAVFAYVDLLTHVPGAWILPPAMLLLASRIARLGPGSLVRAGLTSGLGWVVGYGGMWGLKWVYAALVLGPSDVYDDVRNAVQFRLQGESVFTEDRFGAGIEANMDTWLDQPLTWPVLVVSAVVVFVRLRTLARRRRPALANVGIACLPALVPLVWFEVASNHSQIHHWYTYRSLPIALGVVLLAVTAEPAWAQARAAKGQQPWP